MAKNRALSKNEKNCCYAAELLKALAHPLRLRIVAILCESPENVGTLADRLSVKDAIVSQQLRVLRLADLVSVSRRDGYAIYRLAEPHLRKIVDCLGSCIEERTRVRKQRQ